MKQRLAHFNVAGLFCVFTAAAISGVGGRLLVKRIAAANIGDSTTLKCHTNLNGNGVGVDWKYRVRPTGYEYRIYGNGEVYNGFKERLVVNKTDAGDYDLTIKNVSDGDEGIYTCYENGGIGERESVVLFTIKRSIQLNVLSSFVGGSAVLTCGSAAHSDVFWKFQGRPWHDATTIRTSKSIPTDSRRFEVENATRSDSGAYACFSKGAGGFEEIRALQIFILDVLPRRTNIAVCPTDVVLFAGDNAIFPATSTNGQVLEWYRVSEHRHSLIVRTGQPMNNTALNNRYDVIDSRPGQLDLVIRNVTVNDAGQYLCQSGEGVHETKIQLVVFDEKPTSTYKLNSSETMEISCSAKYSGGLEPSVIWEDENGQKLSPTSVNISHDGAYSTVIVALNKVAHCKLVFPLQKCGTAAGHYVWIFNTMFVEFYKQTGVKTCQETTTVMANDYTSFQESPSSTLSCTGSYAFLMTSVIADVLNLPTTILLLVLTIVFHRRRKGRKNYRSPDRTARVALLQKVNEQLQSDSEKQIADLPASRERIENNPQLRQLVQLLQARNMELEEENTRLVVFNEAARRYISVLDEAANHPPSGAYQRHEQQTPEDESLYYEVHQMPEISM